MLNLQKKLTLNKATIKSPNLCNEFDAADLQTIGQHVWDGYDRDKSSRARWERRTAAAMDLAMQVVKSKNFPWPNCSNVAFPLVTIATLQFHSKAYSALVDGRDIVKARVLGEDPTGAKSARATRVSTHMSYQVLEQDQPWEEQHDKLLINLPIVGCAFKKSYYSSSKGHNVSELVLAYDLVLDYYAKSVEDAARKTHRIPLDRNEIYERIKRGVFRDVLKEDWFKAAANVPITADTNKTARNNRQGTDEPAQTDSTTPFMSLEQHVLMDLDDDGYEEPYIITIDEVSKQVFRIVTAFDEQDVERARSGDVIQIRRQQYFTKYAFIPAPDGGIYDVGFGMLLGPLNESVNSAINQLFDAGTMSTLGGGFLGRGVKIRGGQYTLAPYEWKRVDSTGDDLNKNIVPNPVREPSKILLDLAMFLIQYTERISNTTDNQVGIGPGQNTPAETTRRMEANGQKIYNAIYKRIWRAMKDEFKKLYLLNGLYMPDQQKLGVNGSVVALREDYLGDPNDIVPAADPNITSEIDKQNQAGMLAQRAPMGGYDRDAVEVNLLKSYKIDGYQQYYKGIQAIPPAPNPKIAIEQIRMQAKEADRKLKMAELAGQMEQDAELNKAKILQLEAQANLLMEQAGGIRTGHEIAALDAHIGLLKEQDASRREYIGMIMKFIDDKHEQEMQRQNLNVQHRQLDIQEKQVANQAKTQGNAATT